MKAIFERRSIRKYLDIQISKENIELILKAGMSAPSAGNGQPWQFIVLNDKKMLYRIPEIHPNSHMLMKASHAIVVCGDMNRKNKFVEELWIQDCSAATENMLIMAQDLGLGAVWLGVYPMIEIVEKIKELLSLPEYIIPFSIISLGYPGETKDVLDRYDESRIHWNQW
ncbi:nitroreductase [Anaerosolibacter carboniphilus]|uniref:Nitroreductase n=1 Tax=Anaerosolibacter carboniphilus TaxID=1417629 RepID=A0A841KLA0_9FIRM|nr:nitroreductase family protein [Anaerosolibacter carboniphilus]MBB6214227.1 nitroreductase [Anaerosolibacter carboniphilus]